MHGCAVLLGFLLCVFVWLALLRSDPYALLAAVDAAFWRPAAAHPGRPAFLDTTRLPWCRRLRAAAGTVRREWDASVATRQRAPLFGDVLPVERRLDGSHDAGPGKWRVVVLRLYGRDTALAARFPRTHRLLREAVPDCSTAMFSVLEAGRCVPTHTGPNHAILRYHLGVRVPAGCSITVGGEERHWAEGKDLLFDDTLPHRVQNRSAEPRVVLFLDVPRAFTGMAHWTRWVMYRCVFPYHPLIVGAAERAITSSQSSAP